jgi:hypothetical protein
MNWNIFFTTRFLKDKSIQNLSAFLFAISVIPAFSQVSQPRRYELEQKNSSEYFTVISLKEEGIALVRESEKYSGNKQKWELVLLDTTLKEKHNIILEIDQRNVMLGYEYVQGNIYLLFRTGETTKSKLEFVHIDVQQGKEIQREEIKPELDFKVTHFSKVSNHIVLGGYVNSDPAVLLYNIAEDQIKILPGFFQKETELVDVRVNQNQTFNTLVLDKSTRSDRKLIFRTFDETGNILLEASAVVDENITLHTSLTSTLEREDLIVLGTWGLKSGKQSLGFFSWAIDPFNEQKINYTYFGELNKFLDYLSPKRASRIKDKTAEDLKEGRKPDFTAYAVPFRIVEHKGGFFLLTEVYNPQSTSPYYNTPYGGNPAYYSPYSSGPFWPGYYPGMRMYRAPYMYGNNNRNTDEIKTYETAVVAFDSKGKILWDQSIKLEDLSSSALEQRGEFFCSDSDITLMYKKESELMIKVVSLDSGEAIEKTEKIKLEDPIDEIRSEKEKEGGISHWNNNTFYVYGYQTIRNTTKEKRIRDVFYINKVVVH